MISDLTSIKLFEIIGTVNKPMYCYESCQVVAITMN